MMKKTKLIRSGIMALFVLVALLLVYLVVKQTMPDIIPLLRTSTAAIWSRPMWWIRSPMQMAT